MWNDVRRGLPRKKRDPPKGGLLLLGDAVVEERQQKVLRLGPKFCVEPRLDLVDKLSLTRDIARQVPEKEKDRCVVECVDVVAKASVSRLQDEGYPFSVMLAVGTRLLKKLRRETAPCLETGWPYIIGGEQNAICGCGANAMEGGCCMNCCG
ncbi:hypothetical protein MRX96_055024 [Rhipicephalus microplus]